MLKLRDFPQNLFRRRTQVVAMMRNNNQWRALWEEIWKSPLLIWLCGWPQQSPWTHIQLAFPQNFCSKIGWNWVDMWWIEWGIIFQWEYFVTPNEMVIISFQTLHLWPFCHAYSGNCLYFVYKVSQAHMGLSFVCKAIYGWVHINCGNIKMVI